MTAAAAPSPGGDVRLIYVDDSGAPSTGYVAYSWIEVTAARWGGGLRHWLDLRKSLFADFQVPADYELHASPLIGGRGNPKKAGRGTTSKPDPTGTLSKSDRQAVMIRGLTAIGENTDIQIGSVYRATGATGSAYAKQRVEVYRELVTHLDGRLADGDAFGVLMMDGDGRDTSYRPAHRDLKLADRRLLEDPLFQASHSSQWVQMADIVAWTAYQSVLRHPGKEFAWDWFNTYLRARDVNGGPLAL